MFLWGTPVHLKEPCLSSQTLRLCSSLFTVSVLGLSRASACPVVCPVGWNGWRGESHHPYSLGSMLQLAKINFRGNERTVGKCTLGNGHRGIFNIDWGGRDEEACEIWGGGWGVGVVACWHHLCSLVLILSAFTSTPAAMKQREFRSQLPVSYNCGIIPGVQLLVAVSKSILLFSLN